MGDIGHVLATVLGGTGGELATHWHMMWTWSGAARFDLGGSGAMGSMGFLAYDGPMIGVQPVYGVCSPHTHRAASHYTTGMKYRVCVMVCLVDFFLYGRWSEEMAGKL